MNQTIVSPPLIALSTVLNASSTPPSSSRLSSFGVCTTPMRTSIQANPFVLVGPTPAMLAIPLRGSRLEIESPVVACGRPLLCAHPLVHDNSDAEQPEQLPRDPQDAGPG